MTTGIRGVFFDLPSIRSFFNEVADAFTKRQSALILLPRYVEAEQIMSELQKLLYRLDFATGTTDIGSFADQKPVEVFHSQYPASWESIEILRNASTYLERVELDRMPDVTILDGIGKLPFPQRSDWMRFLADWADSSQHLKNNGKRPPALCLVAHAEDVLDILPKASFLHLTIHWWWNIPSILEMRMLCRLIDMQDGESNCLSEWRENLIPSLAVGDPGLVEFLWDRVEHETETLINELHEYACSMKADLTIDDATQDLIQEKDKRYQPLPMPSIRAHWAKGSLTSSPEHGIELTTLALAQMENKDELRHRIWRAQVNLLLPQIDNVRLAICKYLTKSKGREWPYKWNSPRSDKKITEVLENPLATDLGYLHHLLSQDSHFRDCSQFRNIINIAHELRNRIAHYREVNFVDYKAFVEEHMEALP